MTSKEFKSRISKSKLPKWFNEVTLTINYPHIDLHLDFVGLSSIHGFFSKQVQGWSEIASPSNELRESKEFFTESLNQIEQFLVDNEEIEIEQKLVNRWRNVTSHFSQNDPFFTFDSPKTTFLLSVHEKDDRLFQGAYSYIIGQYQSNSRHDFLGTMLAYEFESKGEIELTKRVAAERKQMKQLRTDFQNKLNQLETQLVDHLTDSNEKIGEYAGKIDQLQENKKSIFNEWFQSLQENFNTFDTDAKAKISDLKKTYEEHLRLRKPAEYWDIRAQVLKKEGWKMVIWLVGLILFACASLYALLWLTPEGMLLSFISGDAQAIKWSIVYVTFISFLAFGIRALYKVIFSSFHLARDAEERKQLVYVYLALRNDSAVDDKDRNLILQSLFSRAETGLLKEESGPTMPNETAGKIFGMRN